MRYLFVLLVLSGCASQQEIAAEQAAQQLARDEAYSQQVRSQCRAYGVKEGTEEFRRCVMQVDMAYRQQSEAQRQMLLQQYIQQQGIFRR